MKKILLGTSALCALAVAGPAGAQTMNEPIKLGFGGYFNSGYGGMLSESGANVQGKRRDDINTDAVLQVKGSSKLDNGITVGAMIQFRAENSFNSGSTASNAGDLTSTLQDVIKKQYIKVVTDFGEVRIGDDDDARRQKAMGAPIAGLGMFGANTPDLIVMSIPGGLTNTTMKSTSTGKRVSRLMYFSPTIAGFSFAASYAPGGEKTGIGEINNQISVSNGVNAVNNDVSLAAGYSGKFGDFSLDAYTGFSSGHRVRANALSATNSVITGRDNPFAGAGGGVVGWGPIKFGAAYEYLQDRDTPVANDGHQSRKTWDIGPEYIMGPFSVSIDWTRGIYFNREVNTSPRLDMISLAAEYALGPGISVGAALDWAHYDAHVNPATAINGTNYSGVGVLAGVGLAF